jgi:rod shape-determining protein MreC
VPTGFSPFRKIEPGRRAAIFVVILLVAQFILMSLHARSRALNQSMPRTAVITVLHPLQKASVFVFGGIGNLWSGYFNLVGAKRENQQLREENDRLKTELLKRDGEVGDGRRLREVLNLKTTLPAATVAANVIGGEGTPWFRQVTLDKGSLDGVSLNSPVITPQGVVGRVIAVGPTAAIVQVITDGNAGLGAMLANSRANGEIRGQNGEFCRLDSISGLNEVKEGEQVLTSGLDGLYPKGILVGTVSQVLVGSGATLHQISVRPSAPIDRLEEVLVLPPPIRVKVEENLKPETKTQKSK